MQAGITRAQSCLVRDTFLRAKMFPGHEEGRRRFLAGVPGQKSLDNHRRWVPPVRIFGPGIAKSNPSIPEGLRYEFFRSARFSTTSRAAFTCAYSPAETVPWIFSLSRLNNSSFRAFSSAEFFPAGDAGG